MATKHRFSLGRFFRAVWLAHRARPAGPRGRVAPAQDSVAHRHRLGHPHPAAHPHRLGIRRGPAAPGRSSY